MYYDNKCEKRNCIKIVTIFSITDVLCILLQSLAGYCSVDMKGYQPIIYEVGHGICHGTYQGGNSVA